MVRAGNLLFIARQVALDDKGEVVGSTMAEPLDRALTNLGLAGRARSAYDLQSVPKR